MIQRAMHRLVPAAAFVALVSTPAASLAQTPPVQTPLIQTLRDEMTRAMTGLRLPGQPAPYYIAYTVDETLLATVNATLGSLTSSNARKSRLVRVEVRVGDYARDNSRFLSMEFDPGVTSIYAQGVLQGPLDDDLNVLRRQLWLLTDAAYRRAVTNFARKQAALQNQVTPEPIPDFSRETPQERLLPVSAPPASQAAWETLVRDLSSALGAPGISSSDVSLYVNVGSRTFVNSEGFRIVTPLQATGLRLVAETQAADGMPLRDVATVLARTPDRLPPAAAIVSRARELSTGLLALRDAPVGEDYTGPVLVEGDAASELLAQTFVPLVLSLRLPESDNPQMASMMSRGTTSSFLNRIGSKVLPETLTVTDTPSLARFGDQDVPGAYQIDDEGVAAQDVTVCDKGVLKTLLTGRTPQRGLLQSNGHGRGGVAQAGVFQVQSSAGVPSAKLRSDYLARLKQEGRPFGYILRRIAAGGAPDSEEMMRTMMMGGPPQAPAGPQIVRAFKVAPDGQETLVRGLQLGVVTHTAYRDILDASTERTLYSYRATLPPQLRRLPFMMTGISASDAIVSMIVPTLLFGELEIQKTGGTHQRPPIVSAPTPQD